MERLNVLAIILLVTTLAVPTWGRMGYTKSEQQEIIDEVMKMEMKTAQQYKVIPVVAEEVVEEPPKTARLHGCAGVGENCVFVPCCPTSSAGNRVDCSRGPYNAVCVEYIPGPYGLRRI